nr:MAG TPA: endonuclease [Bacteriophage sp.]
MKTILKTIRIMLIPNNKQKTKLFQYANTSRFAYNWALCREKENYKNNGTFISDGDLRKEFTQLKKEKEYSWLNNIDCDVPKQAIKDACNAYKRFFKKYSKFPKFKSRKFSTPSFYQDNIKIQFTDTHVRLMLITGKGKAGSRKNQKFCKVRLAEHNRVPINCKYYNPRIKYDGINWYLTVGIEYKDSINFTFNDGVGIDLGIKDLAICSDGNKYQNINKTQKVKKLEKQKRRLQRSISRSYEKNKKGESYCKTNNVIKKENKLLKLNHRLTNIRHNHLHKTTSEIIKREPSFICIEDLNVSGMMKNRHLSKAVQQQGFYKFRRQIEYKSAWNNIPVIIADRFFPSSKLCSCCGSIKKDLKLSDRIYKCDCGNVIDRDFQAALNLKRYGENVLKESVA